MGENGPDDAGVLPIVAAPLHGGYGPDVLTGAETNRGVREKNGEAVGRALVRLGVGFWSIYLALNVVLWGMAGRDPFETVPCKLIVIASFVAITAAMTITLSRLRHLRFRDISILSLVMAIVAASLMCAFNHLVHIFACPEPVPRDGIYLTYAMTESVAVSFGWFCLSLSLIYRLEVRYRQRLLVAAREEGLAARMLALRYQVNPHFLFNTLNSLAALIEEERNDVARQMALSLSGFLRATLTLDPLNDIPLSQEVAIQLDYLEVEQVRFPDRLALTLDIAGDVEGALVPGFILQPLVENAMKHGVAPAETMVEVAIRAWRSGGALIIMVENDTEALHGAGPSDPGIGHQNVTARLWARFRQHAVFVARPVAPGRYAARLELPLSFG